MRRLFEPIALTLLLTACGGGPSSLSAPAIATQRAKLGIIRAYIPLDRYGRHRVRSMRPRSITVHSTQYDNRNGNLMENGKPGRKWRSFLRKVKTSYNRS
jgi:hypothetical protein